MDKFKAEFIENSIYRLNESSRMIKKALEELSDAEMWQRPNGASNTIGNIILHLCGNIRQYAIASLGKLPDTRERDAEFEATDGYTKAELLTLLSETIATAQTTIQGASTEELLRIRTVQSFELSGIGVIIHVVEHYSYHTGQIAFWTKLLKNKALGFYDGVEL